MKNKLITNGSIIFSYYLVLGILFYIILLITNKTPSSLNFLNWDAAHYYFIKNHGYESYRQAFYPLFPFIWKLLGINDIGIVFFNAILYIGSMIIISNLFDISRKTLLLMLSIPSLIFMFLPYSESLFFFSSVLIIWGLIKNKPIMVFSGLFICGITRPSISIIFIALVITELATTASLRNRAINTMMYVVILLSATLLVSLIQYSYTGEIFGFISQQALWGNRLQLPTLPFRSWAGTPCVMLDGVALIVGLLSIYIASMWILKRITDTKIYDKIELLSVLFLAGVTLSVVLYRGGSLFSLNRFVFATPFFMISFNKFINHKKWSLSDLRIIFLSLILYWLFFNSWVHIQYFLKFIALSLYIILFLLVNNENKIIKNLSFYICLLGNIGLQLFFYYRFLMGGWVG